MTKELIIKFFLTIVFSALILIVINPFIMYLGYSWAFDCNFKFPQGVGCFASNFFAWLGLILVPITVALNIFKKK